MITKREKNGQIAKGSVGARLDLVGQKYGRLLIKSFAYVKNYQTYWHCVCDCGDEIVVVACTLRNKKTKSKSCGCFLREGVRSRHLMSHKRFYKCWGSMKARCLNNKDLAYKNYGGRGVTICQRWLSFDNFMEDMLVSYQEHCDKFGEKNTTLDRVNNEGSYNKINCKWSSYKEQAMNRRIWQHFKSKLA